MNGMNIKEREYKYDFFISTAYILFIYSLFIVGYNNNNNNKKS